MKNVLLLFVVAIMFMAKTGYCQDYKSLSDEDFANTPYWVEMMNDESVNFFDVQRAFELYWKDREVTRSSGWKPFKRWEYLMMSRVNADGTRLPEDHNLKAFEAYKAANPPHRFYSGNWSNLGPFLIPGSKGYNGLGRINAIEFHPTDPNTIYIGAPSGGLWVSHDSGETWYTETDVLPTLGVSAILVDHQEPSVMYIGTGDRDAGDAPGVGVMKSFDEGHTWQIYNNGMGNVKVGRMIMHPQNNQIILAAANSGIYKSINGGNNWQLKKNGDFREIVYKTDDPNIVYASASGRFYRSIDGGESFDMISSGLPGGARAVIGVTPSNPQLVYFVLTNSDTFKGLYVSVDAGANFTVRATSPNLMGYDCNGGSGGQAWYNLDVAVDPFDDKVIFVGGVNSYKSSDGGYTWQISSHWWGDCNVPAVHADLHVFEYSPHDGKLYAGNDGGLYWTADGGTNWTEISDGLAISQAYKIGQSPTVKDKVINGYQDNGTATYLGTSNWIPIIGGDGMECEVDHENHIYSYGTLYYGSIYRILNNTNAYKIAGNGSYGINESGGWVTPFLLHKGDAKKMFVGYKNIWRGSNIRTNNPTWEKISNSLAGSNSSNMRELEQSPANYDILYAARADRKLFRCDNVNGSNPVWTDLTQFLPDNILINDLEAHPTDENIVYMAMGSRAYKSSDKGKSWTDITGSLPTVSLNSLAYYKISHEGLYAGTDLGIFYRDNFLDDWILYSDGFPFSGRVTEVEIFHDPANPENDVIRAGTYGRGLWESDMFYDTPVADFTADQTLIPPFCELNFTDLSAGVPTGWNWTFEGANPSNSNQKNPTGITYAEPGTFKVTLVVTNKAGTSEMVKEDYITVSDQLMPVPDFSVDNTTACSNSVIHFNNLSQYCPTSFVWSFSPDNVIYLNGTNWNSPEPVVRFTESGQYSVSLTVQNSNGTATVNRENYILVGGYTMPFYESFEEGFTRGWTLENPDLRKTWQIIEPDYTPSGLNAAFMNHFDYYFMFERDRLISPPLNLSGVTEALLNFKHAYAQRFSQVDSLLVKISTDCGNTWQTIYANGPDGNGGFETSLPTSLYFNPATEDDWCGGGYGADCISLNISQYCNMPDVKIMFEAFNRIGNNLYIDDVSVEVLTSINEKSSRPESFNIYPNPAKDEINVRFFTAESELDISIYSISGTEMIAEKVKNIKSGESVILKTDKLAPGAYFVKVKGITISDSKLLIIK